MDQPADAASFAAGKKASKKKSTEQHIKRQVDFLDLQPRTILIYAFFRCDVRGIFAFPLNRVVRCVWQFQHAADGFLLVQRCA